VLARRVFGGPFKSILHLKVFKFPFKYAPISRIASLFFFVDFISSQTGNFRFSLSKNPLSFIPMSTQTMPDDDEAIPILPMGELRKA